MIRVAEYRVSKVPKGGKGYRLIYIPNFYLKTKLRKYLPYLQLQNKKYDHYKVCHAFIKGRNCVTNAITHIGYEYCISLDIKDFFDSIKARHVVGKLSQEIINNCFIDNAPRQGLPTSPLISNIALIDSDNKIIETLRFFNINFSYTRYADDICISLNEKKSINKVIFIVKKTLSTQGFIVNDKKTKIQSLSNGRIIITGIAVDKNGLHATRKTKKKLRAAKHQENISSARGLSEWAQCKLPNFDREKDPSKLRSILSSKMISCKICGQEKLQWGRLENKQLVLLVAGNYELHNCNVEE